jgi:hypothetical protein
VSPARVPRPRRRSVAVLVALLVAVLAVGGWLALRGDDDDDPDGLDAMRDRPEVAAASRDEDDEVHVRLRAGTDARGVAHVIGEALGSDAEGGTLRLGRALLAYDLPADPSSDVLEAFVAASTVRAPGGRIVLDRPSGGWRIETEVARAAQATPLAREIVARVAPQGRRLPSFSALEVELAGPHAGEVPPVTVRQLAPRDRHLAIAVLDAAVGLAEREPEVSTNGDTGQLDLRADDVADTGAAWRAAAAALRLDRAGLRGVRLGVEGLGRVNGEERRVAVLSGPAGSSADRALALLRTLDGPATRVQASTDLRDVEADVPGPGAARVAAAAAHAAGVRNLTVSWPVPGPRDTTATVSGADDPPATTIADAPSAILRLLPGVARARRAGLVQLAWDRPPALDVPRLRIAAPRWIDPDAALADAPDDLRRLARAIRAVDWPGAARFDLPLGPSGCREYPKSQAYVRIVTTARGRARSMDLKAACPLDDAEDAVRRAWSSTAD